MTTDFRYYTKGYNRTRKDFMIYIRKVMIKWTSKKQKTVALSSTEAEYISAALFNLDMICLGIIVKDFGMECEGAT